MIIEVWRQLIAQRRGEDAAAAEITAADVTVQDAASAESTAADVVVQPAPDLSTDAAAAESTAADVKVQPAPNLSTLTVPLEPAAAKSMARAPEAKPQQSTQTHAVADKAKVLITAEPASALAAKQRTAEAVSAAGTTTSNPARTEAVFCLECMDRLEPEDVLQQTAQPSQKSRADQQPADKQQDAAPEGEDCVKHHLTTPRNRRWMLATVMHARCYCC
jgi:hypothetical protein